MQQPTDRSHGSASTIRGQAADGESQQETDAAAINLMLKQTFFSLISPAETATANTTQLSALTRQPRPKAPTRDPTPGPGPQPATEEPTIQQPATFQGMTEAARSQPPTALTAATQLTTASTVSAERTTLPSMLLRKPGK